MERVRPAARVRAKRGQGIDQVEGGLRAMAQWCRITALDLSFLSIGAEGAHLRACLRAVPEHDPGSLPFRGSRACRTLSRCGTTRLKRACRMG